MALTAQFPDIVANLGVNGFSGGNRARAAEINTNVLEPLLYLKARPVARASDLDGTVSNTTSTSFVDITGATTSITTARDSRLLVMAHLTLSASGSLVAYIDVDIDGAAQGHATNGVAYSTSQTGNFTISLVWTTAAAVSNAAHTVKLRYRTSANTLTVTLFSMSVHEVF
jgi:hypothetical protein